MEKYRLTWAKVNDPFFISDKAKSELEKEQFYQTEMPKKEKTNPFVKTEVVNGVTMTKVDLTNYDKGEKIKYDSLSRNTKGGLLKKKRKYIEEL